VGTTVFSILFIIVLGTSSLQREETADQIWANTHTAHAGAFYADPDNWEPFMPYGVSGIFSG
jgi:hypothetical protein